MRPIRRGASPKVGDFDDYADAKPELVSRLGAYCSYCERRIPTNLAVEHIQPKKGAHGHPALQGRWGNFLLACVNCNSTKGDKQVVLADVLLPDRDNTYAAFTYTKDGKVASATGLATATSTLKLVGLDKAVSVVTDMNGKQVAIDRVSQRLEAWLVALECKNDLDSAVGAADGALRAATVRTAIATGFFSIWMTAFAADADMLCRLIDAFPGTRGSGCLDPHGAPVTPAPNPDGLADGGKA